MSLERQVNLELGSVFALQGRRQESVQIQQEINQIENQSSDHQINRNLNDIGDVDNNGDDSQIQEQDAPIQQPNLQQLGEEQQPPALADSQEQLQQDLSSSQSSDEEGQDNANMSIF